MIYVGAIHPKHLEIAKMYLEAGKSVLCEKPLCMNVKETEELIQLAKAKNVFLMEGIWSRCIPAYKAVRESISAGEIGEVKQVIASFGKIFELIRSWSWSRSGPGLRTIS